MKKRFFKTLAVLTAALSLCFAFSLVSFAAGGVDPSFESQIESFPESYKEPLRALHEKYPQWFFVPMETGLDWNEVISKEYGEKSLVSLSASGDVFKSTASGHYNKETGTFIQKDGGFVTANKLAVSYYMDPRNFLTEENIFQFELLSFDENHTIEAIETVLKGSFMANAKITYFDSEGNKKSINKTYSQAIFEAGQKNDINPCYLASKILNEVGNDGSASVSGKHSTYPGIYNFYNIGATDGSGAIGRGLKWASTGGNYGRPWNTPVKSINGGAEFLAASYIKNGQFTGYLQRFNVNPNGYHSLYTHQYMTNLTGALSQGYSTYVSYLKSGILSNSYVFSIPVFENMPEGNEKASLADSVTQKAKVTVSSSNVRTGPSTYNAKLLTSSGAAVSLKQNAVLTVLAKVRTDTDYYASVLQYPFWYLVKFNYGGEELTGYIPEGFAELSTRTSTVKGSYSLTVLKENPETELSLISLDESIIGINSDNSLQFKKNGVTEVIAYNSLGAFDKIQFKVMASPATLPVGDVRAALNGNTLTVDFSKQCEKKTEVAYYSSYNGEIISEVTDGESLSFEGVEPKGQLTVFVRADGENNYYSTVKATALGAPTVPAEPDTKLSAPEGFKAENVTEKGYTLSWSESENADGYKIYDITDGGETLIGVTSGLNYLIDSMNSGEGRVYVIRAYAYGDEKEILSSPSTPITALTRPQKPPQLFAFDATSKGVDIAWPEAKGASRYEIYLSKAGEEKELYASSVETEYKIRGLQSKTTYTVAVVAVAEMNEASEKSDEIRTNFTTTLDIPKYEGKVKASSITETSFKLSWTKAEGALSYNLYSYNQNGKKKKLGSTKSLSMTVSGLKGSYVGGYSISAVYKIDNETKEGPESDIFMASTKPLKVTSLKATPNAGKAVISWKAVKNASFYRVYLYDSAKKKYVSQGDTTKTSFTVSSLGYNKSHKVRVRVYIKTDCGSAYSDLVTVSFKTLPKNVSSVKLSSATKTAQTISWSNSTGATHYYVYRYDSKTKSYKRIAITSAKKYTVKKLKSKTTYKYKIRPVVMKNGKTVIYGNPTKAYNFKTK